MAVFIFQKKEGLYRFNFFFEKKDTCKLAFNAIRRKITAVAVDKDDVYNVIANVPLSLHLCQSEKKIGSYYLRNDRICSKWSSKIVDGEKKARCLYIYDIIKVRKR